MSGTNSTAKKAFKSTAICSIIEKCGCHNVKFFRMGDIEIEFYIEGEEKPTPMASELNPIVQDSTTANSIETCEEDFIEDRSTELKAQELALLHVEDPMGFEEYLANEDMAKELDRELEGA